MVLVYPLISYEDEQFISENFDICCTGQAAANPYKRWLQGPWHIERRLCPKPIRPRPMVSLGCVLMHVRIRSG